MASSLEGLPESNSNGQCSVKEDKDFFRQWLSGKLKFYNADEEVFLPYITSILEETDVGSTESDEVLESLSDILEGLGLDESGNNDGKFNANIAIYCYTKAAVPLFTFKELIVFLMQF